MAANTLSSVLDISLSFDGVVQPILIHADLSSRYDVVDEEILVGSCSFTLLRVRDTNTLLEKIHPDEFAFDDRLPYWAELWPSSIQLAQYCLEEANLKGKRLIELGCGLGLAGIAAAKTGAYITFTDYEADALRFARYNAMKNLPRDTVDSQVGFRLLDWHCCENTEPVDMIIGADLVYERRNFLPILNFVSRSLKSGGRAVFTDPDRTTGMAFFAVAEREGFEVSLRSHVLHRGNKDSTILLGELRFFRP